MRPKCRRREGDSRGTAATNVEGKPVTVYGRVVGRQLEPSSPSLPSRKGD